ncbi:MAG: nitrous oxide reductase accessory protein NosL [Haloplanus sp.]
MRRRTTVDTTRRRLLLGAVTAASLPLAGCSGSTERPSPISLAGEYSCDQCGMVIDQQPGPSGQTYYREHSVEGHDPPARFCSTICVYRHRFAMSKQGWKPQVTYLTDYATVEYTISEAGDARVISAHLDAGAFAPTETLDVVAGTEIEGAMGPALIPFSDADKAESFASTHGGEVLAAENISQELVARR